MRKIFLLTGALALLSLTSCKKVWDYVKDHPNGYADNCKVDKIYFTEYFLDDSQVSDGYDQIYSPFKDTANFNYNAKGQLISIDYASYANNLTIDGYPSIGFAFAYDSQGRLWAFFEHGSILNNHPDGRYGHTYTYVNDYLVIDSLFTYTSISPDGKFMYGYLRSTDSIFLDSWGRIVKDGSKTYSYDASGNLIKPGVRYTSQKSIFQTDKTLMFITRDYSINTPVGVATQFNSNQLPVKFNPGEPALFVTNHERDPRDFENPGPKVAYQCK